MQFGYILFPVIVLVGFLENVITTFSLLKLYNELPLIMLVLLFSIDVIVFGNTVMVHSYALVIREDFEKFYQAWKSKLKGKQSRMILRSCVPIRVKIGSLFNMGPCTILNTIMQIVDLTVTLLLT